jgi:cell division protein FtsZ
MPWCIVGTVIDDTMGDDLRVTMIATGLGAAAAAAKRQPTMVINNESSRVPARMVSACRFPANDRDDRL